MHASLNLYHKDNFKLILTLSLYQKSKRELNVFLPKQNFKFISKVQLYNIIILYAVSYCIKAKIYQYVTE